MKNLSIDIESYSSVNLAKSGVYRYAEAPDFEVLLFGYSADGAPVKAVDLTAGETLPADVRSALTDPAVTKWAFNAQFERVCLSRYLGYPTGQYLDPSSWHCTMVWAATLGLPLSLEGVGAVLGLEKQKLKEGKDLIRYEAARVDGAGPGKQFFTITLPLLTSTIFFNLIMQMINGMLVFAQGQIITAGKPMDSTLFYVLYLYNQAFKFNNMGYASAMGWIMIAIIAILTGILFGTKKLWVYEGGY